MPSLRGPGKSGVLLLAAVLACGALLRFAGLARELPHRMEPDAFLVYELQALEGDPAFGGIGKFADRYPSLVPRALALLPTPGIPADATGPGNESAHLDAASRPFVLVRALVALASSFAVLGTWLLARRFLRTETALAAAFLAATSVLALLFATQARPHGIQAALALFTVVASLRVREKPSASRIAVAALLAAAAAATLQNGLFAMLPLAAAIALSEGPARRGRKLALAAAVPIAAAAAALFLFYPELPTIDAHGVHLGSDAAGAHSIHPSFRMAGLPILVRMAWEHDPPLAALALAGLVLGIARLRSLGRERARDLAVVLAYAVPYAGALVLDPSLLDRFLLPLIPFLACLAAGAVAWILDRIGGANASAVRANPSSSSRVRATAAVLVGSACFLPPLFVAARFARLAAGTDTLEQAADWIRNHVDASERILSTPLTVLPLLVDAEDLKKDLEDPTELAIPWMAYQRLLPERLDGDPRWRIRLIPVAKRFDPHGMNPERADLWIEDTRAAYVLLADLRILRTEFGLEAFESAARARGELAYTCAGDLPSPADVGPVEYQGARRLWLRLLGAEAFGPGVRIYRMRR